MIHFDIYYTTLFRKVGENFLYTPVECIENSKDCWIQYQCYYSSNCFAYIPEGRKIFDNIVECQKECDILNKDHKDV